MLNFSQFGHWELIHSGFCVILKCLCILWASLVAQVVKNLPALWETWVRSLGWKDPLEEVMATHSSTLARRIPWTEESGRLQSMGSQRVRHDRVTHFHMLCKVTMVQEHLLLPLHQPCNQPFLQGILVPFSRKWYWEAIVGPQMCSFLVNVAAQL